MKESRRIYRVPMDLQLLLASTTLEGVDWRTVRWPFESFLISLECPLIIEGREYDSILVCDDPNNHPDEKVVLGIAKKGSTPESMFRGRQEEQIRRAIQKGDHRYAWEKLTRIAKSQDVGNYLLVIRFGRECFFSESGLVELVEKQPWSIPISHPAMRILFGALLYLQSAPPSQLQPRGWQGERLQRVDKQLGKISLPSEVCHIHSLYALNDFERQVFSNLLYGRAIEASTVHRTGYWHRPIGKGHDPNWPKSEWTRPTIVRYDRLVDGGLPLGSEQILRPHR